MLPEMKVAAVAPVRITSRRDRDHARRFEVYNVSLAFAGGIRNVPASRFHGGIDAPQQRTASHANFGVVGDLQPNDISVHGVHEPVDPGIRDHFVADLDRPLEFLGFTQPPSLGTDHQEVHGSADQNHESDREEEASARLVFRRGRGGKEGGE